MVCSDCIDAINMIEEANTTFDQLDAMVQAAWTKKLEFYVKDSS